ncbi:hypothetical protein ACH5RR_041858 [Cinchona calisaya]|uniref:WAT1-related protein n=1 Tax=Cinchona calisaya TaxID=153742 RepID=A0ABD2XWI5_9GENT
MMMMRCRKWYPFVVMTAIDVAFAISNILLKQIISGGMNHLVFITYRQLISAISLSPVAYFLERNSRPKLTLPISFHLFLSAIVGASITQYLFLLGIEYTSATFSCAFLNLVPVITFIMALPFGIEGISIKSSGGRAKVIGTMACLGGAILLTLYKGMPLIHFSPSPAAADVVGTHRSAPAGGDMALISRLSSSLSSSSPSPKKKEGWIIGCVALFAGTLMWSSWFLLQSNISKRYPCQYTSTAIMAFFSSLQSAILCLAIYRNLSIWVLQGKLVILSIIYAGMVGSGLCFVGMSWCVKKRGPVFTAAFSPFVQIIAAIFEVPVLHEQIHLGSLIGSLVVIVGLYILLWGKNKEVEISESKVLNREIEERKEQEAPQFQIISVSCEARRL